jgi:hypothetical protein
MLLTTTNTIENKNVTKYVGLVTGEAIFIVWTLLLIVWILLGIPLGPGAGLYYTP